MTNRG